MKIKATILTMVGCLTLAVIFNSTLSTLSQAKPPLRVSDTAKPAPSLKVPEIPKSVVLQIRQDMAKRLNLKLADVRVVRVDPKIFDACLNLPEKNEKCKEIAYAAWAVRLVAGKQSWLYHAVSPKSLRNNFRINWLQSLPKDVKSQAISNITLLSQPYAGTIKVASVEPRVWKNNCLELPKTDRRCNSTKTLGWLVKFKSDKPDWNKPLQWVYRSDLDGKILELDLIASMGNIPQKAIANILSDAAKRSQTRNSAWKVDKVETKQWSHYGNDGPSRPIQGAVPSKDNVFGWKVLVSSPGQQWVYYVTRNGIEFDAPKSVPSYLVREAMKAASLQTGKPVNSFILHWSQQVTWDDTCLGATINKPACKKTPVPGWSIDLRGQNELFNFHSRLDRDVRFNGSSTWFPPPAANPGVR